MLEIRNLAVRFGAVVAVDDVSFSIPDGPFGLGLVGESGSGKSTIARTIMRLTEPSAGEIVFDGRSVLRLRGAGLRNYKSKVQIVFQDPYLTLDPRMKIGAHVKEVLRTHKVCERNEIPERVSSLLDEVGLPREYAARHPHQLSGGERQRVAIARALAVQPQLVILDEPTSALDVTVQGRVLKLLEELRAQRALALLLVSHNLAVVETLCEHVAVLYLGQIVETAPTRTLLQTPGHPYTQALRRAVPEIDSSPRSRPPSEAADPPDPLHPPSGCRFHPRCPLAIERCRQERPLPREVGGPAQRVACHRAEYAQELWYAGA